MLASGTILLRVVLLESDERHRPANRCEERPCRGEDSTDFVRPERVPWNRRAVQWTMRQSGSAWRSLAIPASVTCVLRRFRSLSCFMPASGSTASSVTAVVCRFKLVTLCRCAAMTETCRSETFAESRDGSVRH
jgi:hypothetical protein